MKRSLWRLGRWVFLALGLGLLVYVITDLGVDRVASVVLSVGWLFGVIVLLEATWVGLDTVALRAIYGRAKTQAPLRVWIHSAMVAYPIMVLLPVGRGGGEIARGSILYRWTGVNAVARSVRLQTVVLGANAVISIPCAIAVGSIVGFTHPLPLLILGNAAATASIGLALFLIVRGTRLGQWLQARLEVHGAEDDDGSTTLSQMGTALAITSFGRLLETFKNGIVLFAVGGAFTVTAAFVSEGIHLVGAGLGDFVPNAVGITEGAYRLFAEVLDFHDAPERAVALALVARCAQYVVAAVVLVLQPLAAVPAPER